MKKMRMESVDMTAQNIEKLGELFPNCITEMLDEEKSTDEEKVYKKAINFELLKQMVSDNVIDGDEAYEFTWVGKKEAIVEANKPIRKTLRPCPEESADWDNTENLYIEGDNLEVLKLLQESYLGKVKMIYIDPPYNTGKDFIYKDDFKMTNKEYSNESKELDKQGCRMFKNTDTNGRFHSDWCSMIYSRLILARNLLSENGVIFISIDSHELETLLTICNEIFSKTNFIGNIILQTATDNNPTQINEEHEYMVCYAKNKNKLLPWYRMSESAQLIQNQYEKIQKSNNNVEEIQKKLRQWIKNNKNLLTQVEHYNYVDKKGVYSASSNSSNPHPGEYKYDIIHPITKLPCPKPVNGWRWPEKTFLQYSEQGEVHWGIDHTTQPHIKKRLSTVKEQLKSIIYEDNRSETKMLKEMFDGIKIFDNPKPHNVIEKIIDFVTSDNDLIMDFFSGSATTAHAIMQLNAKDGGKRKYIMVQLPEEIDTKSEAYKNGYKNICEIGKERIRRSVNKIISENNGVKFDGGFRVLKLDDTNMNDVYYNPNDYSQGFLSKLESNIKENRSDLDLLFGCLLDWGLSLSLPYKSEQIEKYTIHDYNDGDLIACFDENISDNVIKEIAKKQPLRVVFRDSGFVDSSAKINVQEIFKLISPDTSVKVL